MKTILQNASVGKLALNRSIIAMAVILSFPVVATAKETLICVAEKSTGFSWNGNEWISSDFKVNNRKLLVKPVGEYVSSSGLKVVNYEISDFGNDTVNFYCEHNETEALACGGLARGIIVNFRTLRFQEYYGIGYVHGPDQQGNTPSLTIGTCAKI